MDNLTIPVQELKEYFVMEGNDLIFLAIHQGYFPASEHQPIRELTDVILWFCNADAEVRENGDISKKMNHDALKMLMRGLNAMSDVRRKIK